MACINFCFRDPRDIVMVVNVSGWDIAKRTLDTKSENWPLKWLVSVCIGRSSMHSHELDGMRYGERCSCCPYGYHIDLDFLRYLDTLYSGESLKSLRRIRHSRSGGLTVSSDGFFSDCLLYTSPSPRD